MMAVAKEMRRRKVEDGSEAWWVQRAPREWAERLQAERLRAVSLEEDKNVDALGRKILGFDLGYGI